jgi:hypothetical protein
MKVLSGGDEADGVGRARELAIEDAGLDLGGIGLHRLDELAGEARRLDPGRVEQKGEPLVISGRTLGHVGHDEPPRIAENLHQVAECAQVSVHHQCALVRTAGREGAGGSGERFQELGVFEALGLFVSDVDGLEDGPVEPWSVYFSLVS